MLKQPGGLLVPANDVEAERMKRFKSGVVYPVEIKHGRNPKFHGKVFAFFNFCFEYWQGDREFMDEAGQLDVFRKHLTVLAGYYDTYYAINGDVRIEAKSLAYSSMSQEEFEQCYSALINAALKHIFVNADPSTEQRLLSFF